MSEASCSPDSMQIGVRFSRHIEVYHNIHCIDVDSSCEEIRTHQTSLLSFAEIVEDSKVKEPYLLRSSCFILEWM